MNINLGTNKHPDYPAAKAKGLIESGIIDFADTLYANNCFPLSSCEGHIESFSWFDRLTTFNSRSQPEQFRPFVMFACSIALGKKISSVINESKSKYGWFIYSYLNPIINDLVWVIELKDHRMFNSKIDKQDVRKDLSKLGSLINRSLTEE